MPLKVRSSLVAALVLLALTVQTPSRATTPNHTAVDTVPAASTGAWTVYHRDNAHTGNDATLPQVTSVTTGWTSATMDAEVYAEPLIYNGIVYAATLNNTVYAFNQSTGVQVWSTHMETPVSTGWGCGNVSPQGILGTPVIDTAGGRIYAVTLGNDSPEHFYRLKGLNLATGVVELSTVITTNALTGFDWTIQQERGALAVSNGIVYVPMGGRSGDCGNYHGWVFAVPTDASPVTHHYATPGNGNGYWAAGGVVIDDSTGKIFVTSGNGDVSNGCSFASGNNPQFENDAIVRLTAGTLTHEDFFMPQDWQANWCSNDQDLGSASPLLISPTLMFQSGKWGSGFLLNPTALGGIDGQRYPTPKPASYVEAPVCHGDQSDATFGSFAYATPFIYLECDNHGLVALRTDTATPSFAACGTVCSSSNWVAGGTTTFGPPIVAGGAVWVTDIGGSGLYAFNAANGAQIFHSAAFGVNHFVTPAEAGGQIFVPSHSIIRSFNMDFACAATPLFRSYFSWFDNATAGMVGDNIHLLNAGATASTGCVTLGTRVIPFSLGAGQETHVTFPKGTIGGPVVVDVLTGPAVLASQRVQYFHSFNEVWAMSAAQSAMTSYINWFDRATAGMVGDNIHIVNPGTSTATGSVSLPGASAIPFTVAGGGQAHVTFPAGKIGGPVTITANQPVLSSQRVQYYQSFNEAIAHGAAEALTTSYFNWFDRATAGMVGDNIHVLNPGGASAHVTVTLPGASPIAITVAPGVETHVAFPAGKIGGPVTVSSDQPVLASQRVQYYQSFNEVPASDPATASMTSHLMWFDRATAGMVGDNIHVLNPGTTSANVTVSLPGASSIVFVVAAGGEAHVTFPAGKIGGPITITSSVPVLGAQRVQYYQSFNEVSAA